MALLGLFSGQGQSDGKLQSRSPTWSPVRVVSHPLALIPTRTGLWNTKRPTGCSHPSTPVRVLQDFVESGYTES